VNDDQIFISKSGDRPEIVCLKSALRVGDAGGF